MNISAIQCVLSSLLWWYWGLWLFGAVGFLYPYLRSSTFFAVMVVLGDCSGVVRLIFSTPVRDPVLSSLLWWCGAVGFLYPCQYSYLVGVEEQGVATPVWGFTVGSRLMPLE